MFSAGHIGEALWEMAEEIRRLQASIEQVRLEAAWDESMIWHKLLGSVDPCLGAVDVVAEARTEQAEQIRLLKEKMNDLGDLAENRLHRLRVGTDKQRAMREQIRLLREVRDWMDRGHGDCADWCEPNQPCVNCTLKLKLDAILAAGALEGGNACPHGVEMRADNWCSACDEAQQQGGEPTSWPETDCEANCASHMRDDMTGESLGLPCNCDGPLLDVQQQGGE
jgi:hypothetical protein